MTTTTTTELRAWVGCLGCYNDGRLVGKWVDGIDAEDVTIAELHAADKVPTDIYTAMHEELWCFDHEGYGDTGEFSPMEASRIARYYEDAESDGANLGALRVWLNNRHGERGDDWTDDRDSFSDDYFGTYDSEKDFAQEFATETGFDDDSPYASHIDWERVWTGDFSCDGWWSEPDGAGGVYIFSP